MVGEDPTHRSRAKALKMLPVWQIRTISSSAPIQGSVNRREDAPWVREIAIAAPLRKDILRFSTRRDSFLLSTALRWVRSKTDMRMTWQYGLVALAIAGFTCSEAQAGVIASSTFDTGLDGWTSNTP